MSNYRNPIRVLIADFRTGELDPHMRMRTDSKAYPAGARALRNALLFNTGTVTRRPGTVRLAKFQQRPWLEAFEFDEDEKYILAFSANRLDIYDAEGTLVYAFAGSSDCPWTNRLGLTVEQSGDLAFICHRSFMPRVLRRTSLTTFTIAPFAFDKNTDNSVIYQPYVKFARPEVTLAINNVAVGAGRTLQASAAVFTSQDVGAIFRIFGCEVEITAVTDADTATGTVRKRVKGELDPNPFRSNKNGKVVRTTHAFHGLTTGATITFFDCQGFENIEDGYLNATQTVTVIDEDHYEFTYTGLNNASNSIDGGGSSVKFETTAPTRQWDEQVFSPKRGYPGAVVFHEDRLWFGGSTDMPDGLWSSHTGQYFRFDIKKALDDSSIQKSIGFSSIRHLVSNRILQVFAENSEFVTMQTTNAGLTPLNTVIRRQTPYGSSYVQPMVFDGATMFVQRNEKTIREFLYVDAENAFVAGDLTTISQHLISAPVDLDVMYGSRVRPEQYAFVVNDTGKLAVFHSVRSEQLAAWLPWVTRPGDAFDSVVVLRDEVFFSVLRDGFYWLERITFEDEIWLDFAKVMTSATPQTTWALGIDYANRTVHVTSGDYYLGVYTANGAGSITVQWPVSAIVAGYDYGFEVTPMPPDTNLTDGAMTGRERRIACAYIDVRNTLSMTVNGHPIVVRDPHDDISQPPRRLDGKIKHFNLGFGKDPVLTITQGQPLPITVLGMVMEVSV